MKILYDPQIFALQQYGGVSKYFVEIIKRLPKDDYILNPLFSNNEYLRQAKLCKLRNFPFGIRYGHPIANEIGKVRGVWDIMNKDFDVFHQTDFNSYALRYLKGKPMVTTFHDANYLNGNNPRPRFLPFLEKSLMRANRIITISNSSKNDLLYYYPGLDQDKITVIYHGVEKPKEVQPLDFPFPYILYVGGREKYKNFEFLIKAFARISPKYPELKIICTMNDFSLSEKYFFNSLKVSDRIIHMSADTNMLNSLYKYALFYISPSLYEGFGMPILEAMVNGCPVLLSDASCFPEIAYDAALFFSAESNDDLVDKMESMIENVMLRERLVEKGFNRVKYFSWEKSAKQHIEVYKSLC